MDLQSDVALEGNLGVLLDVIRTGYVVQPHTNTGTLTDYAVMVPAVWLHSLGQRRLVRLRTPARVGASRDAVFYL